MSAGPQYAAGPLQRRLLGSGYRDLWTTPLVVPVLDPGAFGGGLHVVREGGGLETATLHLRDASGRYYLFRSIDKRLNGSMPADVRGTPAGRIVNDLVSAGHPTGALVLPAIEQAVGIPHRVPRLFVMSDHPTLSEHRGRFAGMFGMLVESADDGPDHTLRFEGADRVLGSDELRERLRASPADRIDTAELLKARLVDLLVGDPDRSFDQWRWLGTEREGRWSWSAFPLDRDAAFFQAEGLVGLVARPLTPKFIRFDRGIDVDALTSGEPDVDRLLLTEPEREAWQRAAAEVRAAVTDSVIDEAVRALPSEYRTTGAGALAAELKRRREQLPAAAEQLYERLARLVVVRGTEADDRAVIERHADGTMDVMLYGPRAPLAAASDAGPDERMDDTPYYRRRFHPEETSEVRVELAGGSDRAVVRGGGSPIVLRIVGGPGDDVLADSTGSIPSGTTGLYDHEGNNVLVRGPRTHVDERAWSAPTSRGILPAAPVSTTDSGSSRAQRFELAYTDGSGPILGVGTRGTAFGYRSSPFRHREEALALVGTNGGLGAIVRARAHPERSSGGAGAEIRVAQDLTDVWFEGFGNDAARATRSAALVGAGEVAARGFVEIAATGGTLVTLGPTLRWLDFRAAPGGPLDRLRPLGWSGFGSIGLEGGVTVDRTDGRPGRGSERGLALDAHASAHPPLWDAPAWFGGAGARLRAYLPVAGTTIALRGGGSGAWGRPPFFEAASLGGATTLRGFHAARFTGDGALFAGGDWRIPLGEVTLLTRGRAGVFALADAGRVWLDGASPGGWHRSAGGGVWYETLGTAGSLAVARGEETRAYLGLGVSF